jgi:hypothetical protein
LLQIFRGRRPRRCIASQFEVVQQIRDFSGFYASTFHHLGLPVDTLGVDRPDIAVEMLVKRFGCWA